MKSLLEKVFLLIGDLVIGKSKSSDFSFNKEEKEKKTEEISKNLFIKQIWIDGKFWTVMANSEKELDDKVIKIAPDILCKDQEELNILNNFYTEDKELDENEWSKKRDVWINEYHPNN